MKVLVTGGLGFIGSHVVVALARSGHQAVILDNLTNSEISVLDGLKKIIGTEPVFYKVDYRSKHKLANIIANEKVDGIIHFAAFKAVGESVKKPLQYYSNNVAGFIDLVKLCNKLGLSLVFSSSCTVYGTPEILPVTEETPWQPPASPYGASKQMDEQILFDVTKVSKRFKSIALRYFNPIGAHPSAYIGELPRGVPNNLIPYLTQAVAGLRKELTVYGNDYDTKDGSCIRDYIEIMDLAEAHVRALEHLLNQKPGYFDTFNIGTGHGSSVLEVINTFEHVTGEKVPFRIGPRRAGDISIVYADTNKARRILGWQAKHTLAEALENAWRWQEKLKRN